MNKQEYIEKLKYFKTNMEELITHIPETGETSILRDVYQASVSSYETAIHFAERIDDIYSLPFKVGDTIYRICPKCNANHNGNCKNCAWEGCSTVSGCDVFGLWSDGQYPAERCQIVAKEVYWHTVPTYLKQWNKKVFATKKEALEKIGL